MDIISYFLKKNKAKRKSLLEYRGKVARFAQVTIFLKDFGLTFTIIKS